ncbi:MAG: hypothetical protein H6971_01315 [Gammaproteobacteria bacterium]|nr:hypothetical protein [Gammaproteobacteria bacterium]
MPATVILKSGHRLYTVSKSVGYKGRRGGMHPNQLDDVLLVQYLLREKFKERGDAPLGSPLHVDGVFGPKTHYAILYFQWQLTESGARKEIITGAIEPILATTRIDIDNPLLHLSGRKDLAETAGVPPTLQKALKANTINSMDSISGNVLPKVR